MHDRFRSKKSHSPSQSKTSILPQVACQEPQAQQRAAFHWKVMEERTRLQARSLYISLPSGGKTCSQGNRPFHRRWSQARALLALVTLSAVLLMLSARRALASCAVLGALWCLRRLRQ